MGVSGVSLGLPYSTQMALFKSESKSNLLNASNSGESSLEQLLNTAGQIQESQNMNQLELKGKSLDPQTVKDFANQLKSTEMQTLLSGESSGSTDSMFSLSNQFSMLEAGIEPGLYDKTLAKTQSTTQNTGNYSFQPTTGVSLNNLNASSLGKMLNTKA